MQISLKADNNKKTMKSINKSWCVPYQSIKSLFACSDHLFVRFTNTPTLSPSHIVIVHTSYLQLESAVVWVKHTPLLASISLRHKRTFNKKVYAMRVGFVDIVQASKLRASAQLKCELFSWESVSEDTAVSLHSLSVCIKKHIIFFGVWISLHTNINSYSSSGFALSAKESHRILFRKWELIKRNW
jgi:hypothetical protein